ncbi:hypothetical protein FAY30_24505 [Bacillus sp. S3]|uniref:hypothetical protein n=1 Tax=Bacillus sp. S3 TaxID=486398 RepID=UPI001189348E|nr:hypothetical protein [Bacillus sp. S3]QCJ44791.1 hypothetical protein FAY30_24505 [Bacillus sp. S3]
MRSSRPYKSPYAAMLWSLVLPGFGQLYTKEYLIGIVLLVLEFLINLNSNLNLVLLEAFDGDLDAPHQIIDYSWGLFYPSLYGFAMWQAFNSAIVNNNKLEGKAVEKRTYLSGFFIGLVIGMDLGLFSHDSPIMKVSTFLDNPVLNGILFGVLFGIMAHFVENKYYRKK